MTAPTTTDSSETAVGLFHPDETRAQETRAGTKYEVVKWTCPKCREKRSTLYIDGEWCHGEGYHIAFPNGVEAAQCMTCWTNRKKD